MPRAMTPEQMARAKQRQHSLAKGDEGMLPDSSQHPSRSYFAKALPAQEGGFMAQYGIPGLYPARIRRPDGAVMIFSTEVQAELAAADRMINVLNIRNDRLNTSGSKSAYIPMTPGEIAEQMAAAQVGPTWLAWVTGSRLNRLHGWMTGPTAKDDNKPPHWLRVLLAILVERPEIADVAETVTEDFTTEKRPTRQE